MPIGNNQFVNPWTEDEINLLRNKGEDGVSWKEFQKRFLPKRTLRSVRAKASLLNITNNKSRFLSNSKYSFKEDVWEEPNEESSYYGGFLATDGCFIKYGKSDICYSLRLDLNQEDESILENFRTFCGFDGKIFQSSVKKGTKLISINSCGIWKNALERNFGITERKTYTLQPPNLENDYLKKCFLIGAIDGDGCVTISKNLGPSGRRQITLSLISASKDFIGWVYEQFECIVTNVPLYKKRKRKIKIINEKYYNVTLSGLSACVAIDYLRQFPVPKLDRKWNKPEVLEYIELQKQKYPDKFLTLKIPPQFCP
jgi:hypothetical protein